MTKVRKKSIKLTISASWQLQLLLIPSVCTKCPINTFASLTGHWLCSLLLNGKWFQWSLSVRHSAHNDQYLTVCISCAGSGESWEFCSQIPVLTSAPPCHPLLSPLWSFTWILPAVAGIANLLLSLNYNKFFSSAQLQPGFPGHCLCPSQHRAQGGLR